MSEEKKPPSDQFQEPMITLGAMVFDLQIYMGGLVIDLLAVMQGDV
jgi:hypothetical protein